MEIADGELLPSTVETWLLAPIAAPDFSLPIYRERSSAFLDSRQSHIS